MKGHTLPLDENGELILPRKRKRPRGICRECGKNVAIFGMGGDYLNDCYPLFHKHNGKRCTGQYLKVEPL